MHSYIEGVPHPGAPTMKKFGRRMLGDGLLACELLADHLGEGLQVLEGVHVERLVAELDVEALLDEADQLDEDHRVEGEAVLEEGDGIVQVLVGQVDVEILDDDFLDLFDYELRLHLHSFSRSESTHQYKGKERAAGSRKGRGPGCRRWCRRAA